MDVDYRADLSNQWSCEYKKAYQLKSEIFKKLPHDHESYNVCNYLCILFERMRDGLRKTTMPDYDFQRRQVIDQIEKLKNVLLKNSGSEGYALVDQANISLPYCLEVPALIKFGVSDLVCRKSVR